MQHYLLAHSLFKNSVISSEPVATRRLPSSSKTVCVSAQRARRLLRAAFQTFDIKWAHEVWQSERKTRENAEREWLMEGAGYYLHLYLFIFRVPMFPNPAAPRLMASHIRGRGQWMLIHGTAASLNCLIDIFIEMNKFTIVTIVTIIDQIKEPTFLVCAQNRWGWTGVLEIQRGVDRSLLTRHWCWLLSLCSVLLEVIWGNWRSGDLEGTGGHFKERGSTGWGAYNGWMDGWGKGTFKPRLEQPSSLFQLYLNYITN